MKSTDAFGEYLLHQYKILPEKDREIIERDDGFISSGNLSLRYFEDYPKWMPTEKLAIKLVKGKVLDIGCGAGRHSLYLQRKSFQVTGIDNSPGAIKVCLLRGLKQAKVLSIEQIDKFKPGQFDTVIMMGNNFGLFGSAKKAKLLLKKLHRITTKNAQIIAENRNPGKTSDPDHLNYQKLNKRKGKLPGQLRIRARFRKMIGPWFDYLLVSPVEMQNLIKGTGWKRKKIISQNSPDYIVVLEKE